jgi:6-pyruvoyl-tetrahydropterin synthase
LKIKIDVSFEASHRIINYIGSCQFLHGHTYYLTIIADITNFDWKGMAIDIDVIKNLIKSNYDYKTLVAEGDEKLLRWLKAENQPFKIIKNNTNLENIAIDILNTLKNNIPNIENIFIEITQGNSGLKISHYI